MLRGEFSRSSPTNDRTLEMAWEQPLWAFDGVISRPTGEHGEKLNSANSVSHNFNHGIWIPKREAEVVPSMVPKREIWDAGKNKLYTSQLSTPRMNCAELVSFPVFQIYYVQYIYINRLDVFDIHWEREAALDRVCAQNKHLHFQREITMLSRCCPFSAQNLQWHISGTSAAIY